MRSQSWFQDLRLKMAKTHGGNSAVSDDMMMIDYRIGWPVFGQIVAVVGIHHGYARHHGAPGRMGGSQTWDAINVDLVRHLGFLRLIHHSGLRIHRLQKHKARYRQFIVQTRIRHQTSADFSWRLGVVLDIRQRDTGTRAAPESIGRFIDAGGEWAAFRPLSLHLFGQVGTRNFTQQRPYLARRHSNIETVMLMRAALPLGEAGATELGIEISHRKVTSADSLSRRNVRGYALVLTYRF
jgi:hypothetical protein